MRTTRAPRLGRRFRSSHPHCRLQEARPPGRTTAVAVETKGSRGSMKGRSTTELSSARIGIMCYRVHVRTVRSLAWSSCNHELIELTPQEFEAEINAHEMPPAGERARLS